MREAKLKKNILNNLGMKIIAVLLSIAIWFFVTYRGQSEMSIETPISFKNVPKGLELLRESAKSVTLTLRGHERLLKSLRPMDTGVFIDLSNAHKGDAVYYIDKGNIAAPRTLEMLRVEPTSVKVTLDEFMTKIVPVKATIIGSPEKGFRIISVYVKPSSLAVEGAKSELARIAFLRTEPVDISGLDADITQNVRLNTSGRNVRTKTSEVTLIITIKKNGK